MDDLDRKLIALLRHDARLPVSSLAASLKVSRATVKARIDRLVASGVILGFTVMLGAQDKTAPVRAVMMVEVEGHRTEVIARRLQGFPEVRALHATNGAGIWSPNWRRKRSPISTGCCPRSGWLTGSRPRKPVCCSRRARAERGTSAPETRNGPPGAGRS